jgi:hypothetical protein
MGKIVHITLADDIHRVLKMQAASEGLTIAQMLEKMIKQYCQSEKS